MAAKGSQTKTHGGSAATGGGSAATAAALGTDVPVVGMREPCPCGSGRRYKACHGRVAAHRGQALVLRPFEGLPGECDWVAMRELVPAATASLPLAAAVAAEHAGRPVTLATVLPMAWAGMVRDDGTAFLGLQTQGSSGDVSRDVAAALLEVLASAPGTPVQQHGLPDEGPRLQDLVDQSVPLDVAVHEGFGFWIEGVTDVADDVDESLARANESVVPTRRLTSVDAAYWCRIGPKEHLRWVLPHDEDRALDAFARLHASGADRLGDGTRFIGSFRAHGLLVPVWDLAPGSEADDVEEPATAWLARFEEALADTTPLDDAARRARAGLANRQLTLR